VSVSVTRGKLERLRKKMHEEALKKGISHKDVLRMSQLLDKKLNELHKLDSLQ
jgi:hypothetical protein